MGSIKLEGWLEKLAANRYYMGHLTCQWKRDETSELKINGGQPTSLAKCEAIQSPKGTGKGKKKSRHNCSIFSGIYSQAKPQNQRAVQFEVGAQAWNSKIQRLITIKATYTSRAMGPSPHS